MAMQSTTQRTEGEGTQPEHTHGAQVHSHDHYHVTHHHRGAVWGNGNTEPTGTRMSTTTWSSRIRMTTISAMRKSITAKRRTSTITPALRGRPPSRGGRRSEGVSICIRSVNASTSWTPSSDVS